MIISKNLLSSLLEQDSLYLLQDALVPQSRKRKEQSSLPPQKKLPHCADRPHVRPLALKGGGRAPIRSTELRGVIAGI